MLYELRGSLRGYRLSAHAAKRIKQRDFKVEDLAQIAQYGEPSLVDHQLLALSVPDSPFIKLSADKGRIRVAGGTIVIDPWEKVVVTVYWNYGDEPSSCMGRLI